MNESPLANSYDDECRERSDWYDDELEASQRRQTEEREEYELVERAGLLNGAGACPDRGQHERIGSGSATSQLESNRSGTSKADAATSNAQVRGRSSWRAMANAGRAASDMSAASNA